jgi:hypothetical protein
MSYDLHLFRADSQSDSLLAAKASIELEETDLNPGPIDPAAEAAKAHLSAALEGSNPALEKFVFDYAQIAQLQKVTEAEARRQWRHIELNGPENGNGIQITLYDRTASVTVPYWHRGEAAQAAWSEIWSYLQVLHRHADFLTYDPQLDRVLDLDQDRPAVLASYLRGVDFTAKVAAEKATPSDRPWWKVW